jgi:hypothetical protein
MSYVFHLAAEGEFRVSVAYYVSKVSGSGGALIEEFFGGVVAEFSV